MTNETLQSILDIVHACDDLQLATFALETYPETRHVMNAMNKNSTDLHLHFMTHDNSPKYQQLLKNPHVCLYYFNPENRHAMRLFGKIEIIIDQSEKEKYWDDDYKSYGYSDANDPHYALLRFIPDSYKYYAGGKMHTGKID